MTSLLARDGGQPVRTEPFPRWPVGGDAEVAALADVLRSGAWGSTHGNRVTQFEAEFARYQDARHCVCVCNGTVALDTALRALGVGVGDEVIVAPYTFVASAAAVVYVGAVPVFVDVQPGTHLLDPALIKAAITSRTKAIMAVHIAGRPCDMDAVTALAREHDLAVIEDAAQAHGASWRGTAVGALGDAGTFSFQTSKNISAGEGGAIVTNDDAIADRLYSRANVGRHRGGGWYEHSSIGYNLRLTEFQAAVLQCQLARHPEQQATREKNAHYLGALLSSISGVRLADPDDRITAHGRHLFVFRLPGLAGKRDAVVDALAAEGVPASAGYTGLHRNAALVREAVRNAGHVGGDYRPRECPVSDELAADSIWLRQELLLAGQADMRDIATAVEKVLAHVSEL